jgi:hypothetical protein
MLTNLFRGCVCLCPPDGGQLVTGTCSPTDSSCTNEAYISLTDISRVIKSTKERWGGYVERLQKIKIVAYNNFG